MTTASSPIDLTDRVALISGSTQGLGLAAARALAGQGAHVIISSRKQEDCARVAEELRAEGLAATGIACNIGHEDQIRTLFEEIDADLGRLDILVNNAVMSPWRTIEETDRALFMKALETNLGGYWYMSVEAARRMKVINRGSIINVSSVAALRPSPMLALYGTFKSALHGMTQSFALEYGRHGIRANTIYPGLFDTRLANAFTLEEKAEVERLTPLGRIGDPAEIGNTVLFLASDAASYITGTSLVIDGGRLLT